jgi:hypothetical protein
VGMGTGKFSPCEDRDGEAEHDREFPVAIFTLELIK